jgi:tetratricopeptide (TPR) repeat protein/O-antigen ligase
MSGLGQFSEKVVEAGWLVALAAVPLYFDVYSSRVFEPDKTILLRCLVLVMLAAAAVGSADRAPAGKEAVFNGPGVAGRFRQTWLKSNALARPVAALLAAELLATVTSIAPLTSMLGSYQRLQGTYTLLTYVAFFFLVAVYLRTAEQLNRVVRVALLTSIPICLYGLAQHLQLDPLPWGGDVVLRVTSTMGNAIFLAAYLIMIVPLTAARLVAAIARANDRRLEPTPGDRPFLIRWGAIVVAATGLLAIPLVLQSSLEEIWWAATGFVGALVLLAALPASTPPSRATARVEAIALSALLVLQVAVVFLTQSRGPWLGLFVGGFVFLLLLQVASGPRPAVLISSVAAVALVVAGLTVFNLPSSPLAAYRSIPYVGRLGQLSDVEEGTGRVRVLIWQGTAELLKTHPSIGFSPDRLSPVRLLVGYGPESMHLAYNLVYPPALGDLESRNATPDRNHNDLLDHLVMTGALGLGAYLALVALALRLGWLVIRRAATREEKLLPIGLLAALVAHLAETQTGIAIVSTRTYFWLILALLVAISARPDLLNLIARPAQETITEPAAPRSRRSRRPSTTLEMPKKATQPALASRVVPTIAIYGLIVIIGQVALAGLVSAGVGGVPLLVYGSFFWLLLAVVGIAWATLAKSTVRWKPSSATLRLGVAVAVVVLVGAWFNLSQLAADVHQKQGNGFDAQNQFTESVNAYREAVNLAPSQAFYSLYLGRAYLEVARQATSSTPIPSRPLTLQTVLATPLSLSASLSRGDAFESARVVLEYARDLEPLNPDHYGNLARLYYLWGQPSDPTKLEQSSNYSDQATTLSPHSAQLFDEWALTLLALGRSSDAIDRAAKAASLDPAFATTHVVLGDVLLESGNATGALAEHRRALDLDPLALSDSGLDRRVTRYLALGQAPAFVETLRVASERNPSRGARLAYAYVLSRVGQLPAAIAEYQVLVKVDPADWLSWRNLALAEANQGRSADATRAAQQAVSNAPSNQSQAVRDQLSAILGTGTP